jgi:hypothetical protein
MSSPLLECGGQRKAKARVRALRDAPLGWPTRSVVFAGRLSGASRCLPANPSSRTFHLNLMAWAPIASFANDLPVR